MFMGEYRHSLDAKNRLIIPARFRDELGDTFVVTRGFDGCLTVYTEDQWKKIVSQLEQLPVTKSEVRKYVRSLLSKAQECEFDGQGRIQLPQSLVGVADITKKCVIIGAADHLEIWSEERWDAYDETSDETFEADAETLTEFLK
ncbi:MAG: division/cell wall cluster transcriptional repressor MraZ [Solobacterium sp.]|jgi:MraZ protein|nr:division/cell wall cluster transcriptional repressor MraZ [Solobacterium sp.]MBQ1321707.1 division/cell wall cluster transcriptional repressor MraZ [Solobacterium sp.]MBQ1355460.1 division/cell wall cluster transcriptional repressor MraZ [Solobacterium sp.]